MESYQLMILSSDEVFSRMLELEFKMLGIHVGVFCEAGQERFADTVLLDLDSAVPPAESCYRRLIGFTRSEVLSPDDVRRRCSMILHRPFEIRLLRREVLQSDQNALMLMPAELPTQRTAVEAPRQLVLSEQENELILDGQHISLTPKEYAVMSCLLANRGRVVSREKLLAQIGESSANKTDVFICLLRRKTESVGTARSIFTVRGEGYIIY